ncbi:hypothetical protein D3C75_862940 [compost metagenome]
MEHGLDFDFINRLADEELDSAAVGTADHIAVLDLRDHHELGAAALGLQGINRLNPVLVRHQQIHQHNIRTFLQNQTHPVLPAFRCTGHFSKSAVLNDMLQHSSGRSVVIYNTER